MPSVPTFPQKNDKNYARRLWNSFTNRFETLTENNAEARQLHTAAFIQPRRYHISREQKQAAKTIIQFWRDTRNSLRSIRFNKNGNHPDSFVTFLNNHKVRKKFSYFRDQQLLQCLEKGKWEHAIFHKHPYRTLSSLTNLFAANKITWQQHATIADILQTAKSFGEFRAYPILNKDGTYLSAGSKKYLNKFLTKTYQRNKLTPDEITLFVNLILCLPPSERFFFVFPEQRGMGSVKQEIPSKGNGIRDELTNPPYMRKLNVGENYSHYTGILKLSFGAENALGLVGDPKDWTALVPRLGEQTIDDVEYFGKRDARITVSPDSIRLGLYPRIEEVHGMDCEYPELLTHDHYHRINLSYIGKIIRRAFAHMVKITRNTFDFTWSKDIWMMVDLNFDKASETAHEKKDVARYFNKDKLTTQLFSKCLEHAYTVGDFVYNDEAIENAFSGKPMLFTAKGLPSEIAQLFIIDLVRNGPKWKSHYHISNNPKHYESHKHKYQSYIQLAKMLNEQDFFGADNKLNVIKFNMVIQKLARNGHRNRFNKDVVKAVLKDLKPTLKAIKSKQYVAVRDNDTVYLGFRKKL